VLAGRDAATPGDLTAALAAGRAGLERRGRCAVGDKTILDALDPAVQALRAGADSSLPLGSCVAAAAAAAAGGMRATIPLVARRGLALRLGERSRGHRDPGATSCFLMLHAMARVINADSSP
jgi:dihydroxyacetone kinase-like protein